MGRGLDVWTSGTWSERAALLSGGNKYCRHRWEMIHLFNVPFPEWNPCNPTDMATSPCASPLWNLIRAKTVYQCLAPDIYWKWPLVKVIAKAWKGFVMRPWSFAVVWTAKTEPGVLMVQYISYIGRENRRPQRTQLSNSQTCANQRCGKFGMNRGHCQRIGFTLRHTNTTASEGWKNTLNVSAHAAVGVCHEGDKRQRMEMLVSPPSKQLLDHEFGDHTTCQLWRLAARVADFTLWTAPQARSSDHSPNIQATCVTPLWTRAVLWVTVLHLWLTWHLGISLSRAGQLWFCLPLAGNQCVVPVTAPPL